jgi:hypothetical protein
VTGGRIPREYIPSVDAGIQDALNDGVLAGYPIVGIKATLIDGAYHDVDSSEMAFKIAGRMAFKEAARKANPVLLEPLMDVEVRTLRNTWVTSSVTSTPVVARCSPWKMHRASRSSVRTSRCPSMFGYIGDLRSKTSGPRCVLHDVPQLRRGPEGMLPTRSSRSPAANSPQDWRVIGCFCGTHLVLMAGTVVPAGFRPSARTGFRH